MDRRKLESLMREFGKAYFNADNAGLRACTTEDFEWHQHCGRDAPDGRILRGVEAVCAEIRRRKREWRKVKYDNFENHYSSTLITSTFYVSGIDEKDRPFNVRAVDLYPIRDGKIMRKDSFWKQIQES